MKFLRFALVPRPSGGGSGRLGRVVCAAAPDCRALEPRLNGFARVPLGLGERLVAENGHDLVRRAPRLGEAPAGGFAQSVRFEKPATVKAAP